MAVTKTHPIKSTLKAAIDYICNSEKTDGKLLVSSYGCAAETADIEFAWTRRHAIDKGTNLGRHLIQAFQPGEVTPEQAHEIGMELAKEILGGKYEFVLTTHIDKDHVHNHLIFNAVSFADHKHYHSNKRSYHYIRRTSDRLCKEHGLSVIILGQDKGKSYIEHQATQNGTSYKAKLKAAIDRLLPACSDLEELLRRLQREGYEIKRGKYISAREPDRERFTRLKTLGVDYTEEAIAARIAGRSRPSRRPKQRDGEISLLIDIQNNIKAQQSAGYRRWATIENLKRIADTSNFLTEHGIGSYEELLDRCEAVSTSVARLKADLRDTGTRIDELALKMKHVGTYRQLNQIDESYPHRYTDGQLCLETDAAIRICFLAGFDLEIWMRDFVEPYYFSYEYYQRYGVFPFGERAHGIEGVLQTYGEYFNEPDYVKVFRLMEFIQFGQYRGHLPCPCGSGEKTRSCHGKFIKKFFENSNLKIIVQRDYKTIKEVLYAYYEQSRNTKATK